MSNLSRRDVVGQQGEQLWVRRRVGRVIHVERVHQAAAHHHGPQAIGDVTPEGDVIGTSQLRPASWARRL